MSLIFNYIAPTLSEKILEAITTDFPTAIEEVKKYREVFGTDWINISANYNGAQKDRQLLDERECRRILANTANGLKNLVEGKTVKWGSSYDGNVYFAPGQAVEYYKAKPETHRDPSQPVAQINPGPPIPWGTIAGFEKGEYVAPDETYLRQLEEYEKGKKSSTFDITVYFTNTRANNNSLLNVDTLNVPQGDKSLNLLFAKRLEKDLEELVELESWKAIYNLTATLQKMTGDRDLYRIVLRPMATAFDDVDKRFISEDEFAETMDGLIQGLKTQLIRIKEQEKEVSKIKDEETLSQCHRRLKETDAMRLTYGDYEALCNAILEKSKGSSMKASDKKGFQEQFNAMVFNKLKRLSALTGGNFKNKVADLDDAIVRAITKLESEGGFFGRTNLHRLFLFSKPQGIFFNP